jgi:hypothetical protein
MERGSIYPSWRYHVDGRSVKCLDAAQDADLEDWSDKDVRGQVNGTPIDFDETVEVEVVPEPKRKPGRPRKDS